MDLHAVEKKWQQRWQEAQAFVPLRKGKKVFVTVPYPYTSGPLHIGHARTYTLADLWARYQRLQGKATLFPMAFHISGTPILSVADRIREGRKETLDLYRDYIGIYEPDQKKAEAVLRSFTEPKAVADFFSQVIARDFQSLGFSIDWTRSFTTGDPAYRKFIAWQFLRLRDAGVITRGSHAVQFCTRDQNAVGEDDIRDGDLLDTGIEAFTAVKFPFRDGFLVAATLRPETLFGATNLWIRPDATYVKARVDGEIWYLSAAGFATLGDQHHTVKEIERFPGKKLAGSEAQSPVEKRILPVLPADFVDPAFATGVVFSVPAHAPEDYVALRNLGFPVEPIPVITVPGYGPVPAKEVCDQLHISSAGDRDQLKEATRMLYKAEFYQGVLARAGPFSGTPVKEIKGQVAAWLKSRGKALDFFVPKTPDLVCRCGARVVVKVLPDQWFINYGDPAWKAKTRACLKQMAIIPEGSRASFEAAIEWLHERACARRRGLGTALPWDEQWTIESLSDSTIYPAFYLLAHLVRDQDAEKLVPAVFDFALLGKGTAAAAAKASGLPLKLLQSLRKEFSFWYPVDLRHTAVPHLTNHLTFYLFTHALLFPEQHWPKAISLNELLVRDGHKMSKSKGNVIPLADVSRQYSADLYRLYIASGADMSAVIDWTQEGIETVRKRLLAFIELAERAGSGKSPMDAWLRSRFHTMLQDLGQDIEGFRFRSYAQRAFFGMMNDVAHFFRRGGKAIPGDLLKDWFIVLSPLIPHVCEELWERQDGKGLVSLARWPRPDPKAVDPALEAGEDLVGRTVQDIREILKLVDRKPGKVHLYVAPDWKYVMHRRIADGADLKTLMADPAIRAQGKAAAVFFERAKKLPAAAGPAQELAALHGARTFLEREFGCPIEVVSALQATGARAAKAEPGKPGIEVV
ncbi:MAG: leucine--tRNA ligase [Candidatus Aenigmarchaeota archaeon]|nr:leucine--tRNA ligase [Candidatus Aenigmarchaeota archaeon]